MTYDEALQFLHSLHRFGIRLGNDRFSALLNRVGNPQHKFKAVHIAGTKGKGSTTSMVASILKHHGFHVGGYYSPFVYDVRERVQIDGEMISREDFAALISQLKPHLEALEEAGYDATTEFELKTALGFIHFVNRGVEFAAVEVGLGGRLDATNLLSPQSTVITNIGLDHVAILGDTLELIAAEKAGIIKQGIPLVTAVSDWGPLRVILGRAIDMNAPVRRVTDQPELFPSTEINCKYGEETSFIQTDRNEYPDLILGMGGRHQLLNAACAIGAVEDLAAACGFDLNKDSVRQGLLTAAMPGRYEVIQRNPKVILDGAHNEISAKALAKQIREEKFDRLHLVVGTLLGHDVEDVLNSLAGMATGVYATQPSWEKSRSAAEVADCARRHCSDVRTYPVASEAYAAAIAEAQPNDLVLVTGSFYLLGEAIGRI
ncbi:MAG: folylpolyglutamate synthase/dihydrofolate synthase family protein [Chthonomonadales bacterium]